MLLKLGNAGLLEMLDTCVGSTDTLSGSRYVSSEVRDGTETMKLGYRMQCALTLLTGVALGTLIGALQFRLFEF